MSTRPSLSDPPARDAFPRTSVIHAELRERSDGTVTVTLELPDGTVDHLSAPDRTEARAALLLAARRFLRDHEHAFGRLAVLDDDRAWELALPADPTQEPVILDQATHPRRNARVADTPPLPPRAPHPAELRFPETPTIEAQLVRSERGAYEAALTLPDGHDEALAGDDLDAVREQVIDTARGYLRAQGLPGRLRVQDPDGTWLLGVPLDDSDLVPLPASAITEPAATAAETAPPPAAASRRESPVLPARPTITTRHPATPRQRRPSRSLGRRVTAAGALLLAIAALVAVADAVQSPSPGRNPRHAIAAAHAIPTAPVSASAITGSVTTPAAHLAPRGRPRPRPHHTPARHHAATAHHATRHAARAHHVTHHATPAPSASSATPTVSNSTAAPTSSTLTTTTSAPTSTYTPPVSSYTPPASTGGYSNSLPAPGNGPPPL